MSLPDLDRAIQRNELDYPVKPDNDDHWNRVRYELNRLETIQRLWYHIKYLIQIMHFSDY